MKDELESRNATKHRALESGCWMWTPVLPVTRESNLECLMAAEASAVADTDRVRQDRQRQQNSLAEIAER